MKINTTGCKALYNYDENLKNMHECGKRLDKNI